MVEHVIYCSVWSLEFAMRIFAAEGHVITISSVDGVNLTLTLQSGDITWQLQGQDGSLDTTSPGNGLPVNTWVNMVSELIQLCLIVPGITAKT